MRQFRATSLILASPVAVAVFAASAGLAALPGCSTQSSEIIVPDEKDVPPPSAERGEVVDPSTYKKVKIE